MELMLLLLGSTLGCGVCGWWFGGLVAHDLGQQPRPPFVLPPPEQGILPAL